MSAEPREPDPAVAGRPDRDGSGRPRGRRGGRRGGRRRGGAQSAGTRTGTGGDQGAATPAATEKPASEGNKTDNGGRPDQRGRRHRRRKPSRPTEPATETVAGTAHVAEAGTARVVTPSDVSALGKPRGRLPADPPGRPERTPDGPKLRTVRETSAGGLVVCGLEDSAGERCAALIGRVDRRGRMMWSLPKGHIETGETAEQTAVREVAEETGITGNVVATLGKIEYWFVSDGKRIHKTVHHYLMRSTGGELSDADYEVAAVAWVPLAELPHRLTYSDERRLARAATDVIDELGGDPERMARSEADYRRTVPNDYEKAAAARNQRRNDAPRATRSRRRRRGGRRSSGSGGPVGGHTAAGSTPRPAEE